MKIRIDVTDDDIRRGTPQSGNGCAVYTAVKRAGLDVVNVTREPAASSKTDRRIGIDLPETKGSTKSRAATKWSRLI